MFARCCFTLFSSLLLILAAFHFELGEGQETCDNGLLGGLLSGGCAGNAADLQQTPADSGNQSRNDGGGDLLTGLLTETVGTVGTVVDDLVSKNSIFLDKEKGAIPLNPILNDVPTLDLAQAAMCILPEEVLKRLAEAVAFCNLINSLSGVSFYAQPLARMALLSDTEKKKLCGVPDETALNEESGSAAPGASRPHFTSLPESFDVRNFWPDCKARMSIINDQGYCQGCWAIAMAEVVQDRMCISQCLMNLKPQTDPKFQLSSAHIMSCSGGAYDGKDGCKTGWPYKAADWVARYRMVTGGDYASKSYCMPFPFSTATWNPVSPKCPSTCTNTRYGKTIADDKNCLGNGQGIKAGRFRGQGIIEKIKWEIIYGGSVCATMRVPRDFYYYTKGIYQPSIPIGKNNPDQGWHAVKIFGWGREKDASGKLQNYWLCANSWGQDWGLKGFFKIVMGQCSIDSNSIDFVTFDGPKAKLKGI